MLAQAFSDEALGLLRKMRLFGLDPTLGLKKRAAAEERLALEIKWRLPPFLCGTVDNAFPDEEIALFREPLYERTPLRQDDLVRDFGGGDAFAFAGHQDAPFRSRERLDDRPFLIAAFRAQRAPAHGLALGRD